MSDTQSHNWMYGKALYLEVRDAIKEQPVSNLDIRAMLVQKHGFVGDAQQLFALDERIRRTTVQLHLDGYLERATVMAKNKNPKYVYTLKATPRC